MILKSLIFLHRWVGIVLCLVFLLWFPSGIGMMYWGFPGVSAGDKLDHSPKLDPAKIVLSPTEAAEKIGIQANPTQVRLNSFDGRPVYRFTGGGGRGRGGGGGEGGGRGRGGGRIIYADTGEEQTEVSSEMLDRIASAWSGKPVAEAKKISVEDVDQWTVAGQLRNLRPMFKYTWPDGQQVYLNGITGEVVQYTTFWTRVAAHVSAIPHWVYYTPLRQNQPVWINFMIYASLIGTGGAIVGMVVAVMMYSPKQKYRLAGQATGIPYRGQKRWHWIIGMVFGVATVTWTFSGLMSLGPFPLMQRLTGQTPRNERQQGQPQQPAQVAEQTPSAPATPAAEGVAAAPATTPSQAGSRGEQTPRTQRAQATAPPAPAPAVEPAATPQTAQATGGQESAVTPQVQAIPQTEQRNPAADDGGQNRGGRGRGGRGGRGGGGRGRGGRGRGGQGRTQADGTPAVAGQAGGEQGARSGNRSQDSVSPAGTAVAAVADQGGRGQGGGGRGGGQQGIAGALRGRVRMSDFADVHPRDLLAKIADLDVKEIEYTSFASTPLVSANLGGGKSQLLSLDGKKIDGFDQKQVIDIVTKSLPDPKTVEIRMLDQYDLYYFDRTRQRPLPVILALTHDADNTRYYVDPKSARVMTTYNDRNWVNRWLYTGLHSLNFPFLYNHRPLWDIVVITFMVGGTALCVTSLVLAWRVLGRKLKRAVAPPTDVLTAEG